MKSLPHRLPLIVLAVFLAALVMLWAGVALAHKVNVFAVAEGGAVCGEGYFSGGAKAQSVPVEIQDASGAVIAQGVTEKDGTFKIPLPASVSPPLKIVLKAGDGHQNDFTLTAQDLAPAVPASAPASAPALPATVSPSAASGQAPGATQASSSSGAATASVPQAAGSGQSLAYASGSPASAPLDEARLAALVEAAVAKSVDEKLAPLKLQLARMAEQDQSARMRDIIGGIGWIIGLVGIAAWFKRPKN
jgi:nickel transport protein